MEPTAKSDFRGRKRRCVGKRRVEAISYQLSVVRERVLNLGWGISMRYRLVTPMLVLLLAYCSTAQSNTQSKPAETCENPENPARGIVPPRLVNSSDPAIPRSAGKGIQPETVTLTVVVGSNGRACGPEIKSSPGPEFERSAMNAIRHWKWKPASREGKPVPVRISIEMNFQKSQ